MLSVLQHEGVVLLDIWVNPESVLVKTWVFFHTYMIFYSLLDLKCKTELLLIDSVSLSSLNISSEFGFNTLWNNHGTSLSSSYLSFPTEQMKPALFKILLGEAFYPAAERWSLTEPREAINSEGLITPEMGCPVSAHSRGEIFMWKISVLLLSVVRL